MYEYRCTIERVIDGDTVDVHIDLGFNVWLRERVRVWGVNAPEIRGKEKEEGLKTKARVEELLPQGSKQIIRTTKDKRGKFGRILADFVLWTHRTTYLQDEHPLEPDTTLSKFLIDEGLAAPV